MRRSEEWVFPDGSTVASLSDCYIAVGAGWRIEVAESTRRPSRRHRMDPVPAPLLEEHAVTQVQDDATLLPILAAHAAPTAHELQAEAQPDAEALAKIAEGAGDNPMLALGLAVLAVVGGGSAWKLWTKRSEQSHELAMKRLELEAATMNGTAQPPPCQVKQAEVDAKLAALEARIAKAEKTSLALPEEFDADELVGRLSKVEAALKRIGLKPPAATTKATKGKG